MVLIIFYFLKLSFLLSLYEFRFDIFGLHLKLFFLFQNLNLVYDLASLYDNYSIFPEFFVKYAMFQVFLAVSFLHSNRVVHADIKRENIAFVYSNGKKYPPR